MMCPRRLFRPRWRIKSSVVRHINGKGGGRRQSMKRNIATAFLVKFLSILHASAVTVGSSAPTAWVLKVPQALDWVQARISIDVWKVEVVIKVLAIRVRHPRRTELRPIVRARFFKEISGGLLPTSFCQGILSICQSD